MNRIIKILLASTVAAIGFVGCGLLDPDEDTTPTITLEEFSYIDAGATKNLTGKVKAGEAITSITYTIENSAGEEAVGIDVDGPSSSAEKTIDFKDDDKVSITVGDNVAAGTYTLIIKATAGVTASGEFDFEVKNDGPTGTPVVTDEIEAGANANTTLGSSIDLDGGSVMMMSEAASNISKIDICYAHTASSGDKVGSALWAKNSDYDFAKNWTNPPDCKILELNIDATAFNEVDTKEEIEALWTETGTTTSLTVVEGDVFIVKTTEDVLAIARITSQVAGKTGKITIKYAK